MGILDGPVNAGITIPWWIPSERPAGLGWSATYDFTVDRVTDGLLGSRPTAEVSVTPEGLFDAVSTARSAPANTYYIDYVAGSDAGAGTVGSPWKSIWKGVEAANASGSPAKIVVAADRVGSNAYWRTNNPWYGTGGATVVPTVDIALLASGGRVVTGAFDPPGTPSRDATHVNTYSWSLSNADRVCDMRELNRFGNYTELVKVPTAALCNAVPNSWALVSGTIYVHRRDQAAVTNTNTRVFRTGTATIRIRNQVNVYIGGVGNNDGFDFQGGELGVFDCHIASPTASVKRIIVDNCTFRYAGGYTNTGGKSVSVESWNGLAAFFNCAADAGATDGFNFHNFNAAAGMYCLTVNCSAVDCGRNGQSSNSWTLHEDVKGIDVAGFYDSSSGGNVRNIDSSKALLVGTVVQNDRGDVFTAGGVMMPTQVRVDNTATIWAERVRIDGAPGSFGFNATTGATIHKRNCWPTSLPDAAEGGTIDTY